MNLDGNQASIREVCDAGLLAGAVTMVWQREKLLQVNEIGYRDIDAGVPMQRDTLFRIASMTKPVTVAAAMSLVDEGKLALRDPITRWAPELCKVAVLDDAAGPLDRTHPARRAILSRTCSLTPAAWLTVSRCRGQFRGPISDCRSARVPTFGWQRWQPFRSCTNLATG